jgi:hypothetical protein
MKMKKQWFLITVLSMFIASLLLTSLMIVPAAEAKGTETIVTLNGSAKYPNAKGKAKYKVDGSEREFQVEVENVKALAGKTLYVYANVSKIGSFTVNNLGAGGLNRNTDKGQFVPFIKAGVTIQIKTAAGVLVASGHF